MSTSADRGLGPESDAGPWETLELLTEVVDGIAAVQRETLDPAHTAGGADHERREDVRFRRGGRTRPT